MNKVFIAAVRKVQITDHRGDAEMVAADNDPYDKDAEPAESCSS